tara:strand:- start:331 stop:465 length:135 start_codon:yes stop_codon:yes gene_type:complete
MAHRIADVRGSVLHQEYLTTEENLLLIISIHVSAAPHEVIDMLI